MLTIDNLTKKYLKSDVKAVDGLSLEIENGEIFGFLGPNGAGKSTTIKCLTGILPFSEGDIKLDGVSLLKNPIEVKMNIGYVPDTHDFYERLTGAEYINFMANVYGVNENDRKNRFDKYVSMFRLSDAINDYIKSYSHGMRQKISIIGALIHNPKLWVLDEPLTGLDPQSAFDLKELMKQHCAEGNSVFFSSHVLEVVEKICDRVAIINKGKLVTVCDINELKEKREDLSLEELFLSLTGESQ